MNLGLQAERALVTGDSCGIGLAIARRLALEGVSVAINAGAIAAGGAAPRRIHH